MVPAPAALVVFGSFARHEATSESDLDVLAVRPDGVAFDDDGWFDALEAWTARARAVTGLPVEVVDASAEEIPDLLARPGKTVWRTIAAEGWIVSGSPLPLVGAEPALA
jgi:predicted nucleotidyltransferase